MAAPITGPPPWGTPDGPDGTGGLDPPGVFGTSTESAVREFQQRRGLRVDGICGDQTWSVLVEAGHRLGDRLLYLRRPALRGDDVAGLQQNLGALGFDAGRVDGIFGHRTASALAEFQRNVAIPADGICGGNTVEELARLQAGKGGASLVTGVREREHLRRAPRTLSRRRLGIGQAGGLGAMVEAVCRELSRAGADAFPFQHPSGSRLAHQANDAGVEVYVGLGLDPAADSCKIAYYSGYRYESTGGRRLAELVTAELTTALDVPGTATIGMSIPELRETRMPAVLCEMTPPSLLVEHSPQVASALVRALLRWASAAWD
ncbi:MAG: peptidoglycan-binding protein [Acidimicrobiales bacterium]